MLLKLLNLGPEVTYPLLKLIFLDTLFFPNIEMIQEEEYLGQNVECLEKKKPHNEHKQSPSDKDKDGVRIRVKWLTQTIML